MVMEIFVLVHLVGFVLYTSKYSTINQEITRLKRRLNVPGIEKESLNIKIEGLELESKRLKGLSFFIPSLILVTHLLYLTVMGEVTTEETIKAFFLFLGVVALFLIANWMKGAGTIDRNIRTPRGPWI